MLLTPRNQQRQYHYVAPRTQEPSHPDNQGNAKETPRIGLPHVCTPQQKLQRRIQHHEFRHREGIFLYDQLEPEICVPVHGTNTEVS